MATLERSIISGGGGDYTTIAAWEAAAPDYSDGDIWKGQIEDNAEYNESVTLQGGSGTPSATAYLWLTVHPDNRHSGVAGTGHARMRGTSGHVITIHQDADYARVSWLDIQQDSSTSSAEGIRIGNGGNAGPDNVLIQYCVIWSDTDTSDQDGIYMAYPDGSDVYVDNCIIYGFQRSQIQNQAYANVANTQTYHIDHCTLIHQSSAAEVERGAVGVRQTGASNTSVVNMYNTIVYMEAGTDEPLHNNDSGSRGTANGTMTWNGTHNLKGDQSGTADIAGTDNMTNWQTATDGDSESDEGDSGSYVVFNDITSGSEDFTLLAGNDGLANLAINNGTDRQGSEPDSRQDFSIDITGGTRGTTYVDIGAHQEFDGTRTRVISKSGGDYSTIGSWEADAPTFPNGIWKGEIQDNSEYLENVDIDVPGTPDADSYMYLTVAVANRHDGAAGTGHARQRSTGTSNPSFHIHDVSDYTRVEYLEIKLDSGGSSDEAIRLGNGSSGPDNVLISRMVIWTDDDTSDQDGIYINNASVADLRVDNSIVYGFQRGQIHAFLSGSSKTVTMDVDHCTLIHQSSTAEVDRGGLILRSSSGSNNVTADVYNTIGYMEAGTDEPFADSNGTTRGSPSGTVTWNGSHNLRGDQSTSDDIGGTDNTTNWQSATDGDSESTQSSGSYVVFNDITVGTEDFTLLDAAAGNLAAGNGTNRQGSEPDSRQDFSIDIADGARPTTDVDIGAHQESVPFVGSTPAVISRSFTAPAPTPSGEATVVQTEIDRAFTLPGASVEAESVVNPTVLSRAFANPTPQLEAAATVLQNAINRAFTVDGPSATVAPTTLPSVTARVFTVPTPTTDTGSEPIDVNPAVVVTTHGMDTPTILAEALIEATVIARDFSVDGPTVSAESNVTPGTTARVFTVPTPMPSIPDGSAPATVITVGDTPTPSLVFDANLFPSVIAAVSTVPNPQTAIGSVALPEIIDVILATPQPQVSAEAIVTQTAIDTEVTMDTPSIVQAVNRQPSAIAVITAVDGPQAQGQALRTPSTVPMTTSVPNPVTTTDAVKTPATIAATTDGPTPGLSVEANRFPDTIVTTTASDTPFVGGGTLVQPGGFEATTFFPIPSIDSPANVAQTTVQVIASADTPTLDIGISALPGTVVVDSTLDVPTIGVTGTSNPATIDRLIFVPHGFPHGQAETTPAVINVASTLDTPAALVDTTALPSVILVTAGGPTPVTTVNATVTPDSVDLPSTLSTPSVRAESETSPATVIIDGGVPTPTLDVGTTALPVTVTVTSAADTPGTTVSGDASPTTVDTSVFIPFGLPEAGTNLTPTTINVVTGSDTPTIDLASVVRPNNIFVDSDLPQASVFIGDNFITVTPDVIDGQMVVLSPTVSAGADTTPAAVNVTSAFPTPLTKIIRVLFVEGNSRVRNIFDWK